MTAALRWLRERPATLAAAAVLVLAVWEIATLARVRAAAPREADWRAAAAAVEADLEPRDLVVFAPAWVDPVGRMALGHRLSLDDLARMDAARYARIWELSIRGARAPETAGLGRPAFDRVFGAVRVRRYDRPAGAAAEVVWALHDQAPVAEVAHRPHRCVILRPPAKRDAGTVTLGSQLVVTAGLSDVWARRDNRAFARLDVIVDGEKVTSAVVGNDSGWVALPVVSTIPGPHQVRFEAAIEPSRGDPKKARIELCVAAEARK